jgi:uridine kinase
MSSIEQTASAQRPLVIGIAGCSGSGKSTLAAGLARALDATVFPLDFYYRDLTQFPLDSRHKRNFDHPDSLESELIVEHVQGLARGLAIQRPVYNFKQHARVVGSYDTITPGRAVIVEGILALHYADLLSCYSFSIYVDAPDEICLARRIERDMRERNRTEQSIRDQFLGTTQPMAQLYVVPSKARATITVDGTQPTERLVEQILRQLDQAGHMPSKGLL